MECVSVSERSPRRIAVGDRYLGLRTIARVGDGEGVVFARLDDGTQFRLFRAPGPATAAFRLVIDRPVTLSFRGRGKAVLTFAVARADAGAETVSYLVERGTGN